MALFVLKSGDWVDVGDSITNNKLSSEIHGIAKVKKSIGVNIS